MVSITCRISLKIGSIVKLVLIPISVELDADVRNRPRYSQGTAEKFTDKIRSLGERLYPRREPGNFSRRCVLVNEALGGATHDLRLCILESGLRRVFIAGSDRFLNLLDRTTDPASPVAVDFRAPLGLPYAFFSRW